MKNKQLEHVGKSTLINLNNLITITKKLKLKTILSYLFLRLKITTQPFISLCSRCRVEVQVIDGSASLMATMLGENAVSGLLDVKYHWIGDFRVHLISNLQSTLFLMPLL